MGADCFCCFPIELSASCVLFSAGILVCREFGGQNNSQKLAVPPLFCAVLAKKCWGGEQFSCTTSDCDCHIHIAQHQNCLLYISEWLSIFDPVRLWTRFIALPLVEWLRRGEEGTC